MITKRDKNIILMCAKKFNASSVILFGSSVRKKDGNDIDLAVKGIKPELFFQFYGELFKYLPKPVDLVDLDKANAYFANRILEEGEVIYEA